MIAHVNGIIVEKFGSSLIIDVHDIGYEIQVSTRDFDHALLDEKVKFYTYHHVREQSEELYGFSSLVAKKLFELLITVQGVGPKAALAILSLGELEGVRNAIASGDSGFIAKASGVGKKIAERVAVDLSDKVGMSAGGTSARTGSSFAPGDEALEALMSLGYSLNDASSALKDVPHNLSTAERIKQALKGRS